jgi:7-cyano-7-deazaguanine synthase
MDSATVLAVARAEGFEAHTLAFEYGQRHRAELAAAAAVARALGAASHRVVPVGLSMFGGSALTGPTPVPKDRPADRIGGDVPVTYVPARNTVFLALGLAAAEASDAEAVYVGVNALDTSGYPDCRPEFLESFERTGALGTRRGLEGRPVRIRAPLMRDTKADVVRRGAALGVPFGLTFSCYDPAGTDGEWRHCRRCDACLLRARGFAGAGLEDPAP